MAERGAGLEVELSDGHTTFLPFSWLREVTRWGQGQVSWYTVSPPAGLPPLSQVSCYTTVSPRRPAPPEPEPELWGGDHQVRRHQFELLEQSDAALLAWLQVCRVVDRLLFIHFARMQPTPTGWYLQIC